MTTREDIVRIANSWIGLNELDGSYKPIVDIYNTIDPLPSGYILKYTDDWGIGAISAMFQQAKASNIFPSECSCVRMIESAKKLGMWVSGRHYLPDIGDVVLYNSHNNDFTIDTEYLTPDSAGLITSVDKSSRSIVAIQGNKKEFMQQVTLSLLDSHIKGFVCPRYEHQDIPSDVQDSDKIHVHMNMNNTEDNKDSEKSKSESITSGTLSRTPSGTKLKLNNVCLYATPKSSKYSDIKSGIYYIWSVTTINNKVRITNLKKNVGIKGQVTGWISIDDAIDSIVDVGDPDVKFSEVPVYLKNAVYVIRCADLKIYTGPGTDYDIVPYKDLTGNAKKYDSDRDGCLDINTKVTCLSVNTIGSNVWIQIPSGWILAYTEGKYLIN